MTKQCYSRGEPQHFQPADPGGPDRTRCRGEDVRPVRARHPNGGPGPRTAHSLAGRPDLGARRPARMRVRRCVSSHIRWNRTLLIACRDVHRRTNLASTFARRSTSSTLARLADSRCGTVAAAAAAAAAAGVISASAAGTATMTAVAAAEAAARLLQQLRCETVGGRASEKVTRHRENTLSNCGRNLLRLPALEGRF